MPHNKVKKLININKKYFLCIGSYVVMPSIFNNYR